MIQVLRVFLFLEISTSSNSVIFRLIEKLEADGADDEIEKSIKIKVIILGRDFRYPNYLGPIIMPLPH